ncbi:MAG: PKD domain-containing protein [Thermoflexales bacterium]|nr:PKD domain-containing protein [Thermoflexales bacterium]
MNAKKSLRFVVSLILASASLVGLLAVLNLQDQVYAAAQPATVGQAVEQVSGPKTSEVLKTSEVWPSPPQNSEMIQRAGSSEEAASPSRAVLAPSAELDVLTVCGTGCDYSDVQAAVSAVPAGGTVKVAAGVYTDTNGDGRVVRITKTLSLLGGYTPLGNGTPADWDTPDPQVNPTILDAQGQGQVVYINDNVAATVAGFHIRNGRAASAKGSGVYVGSADSVIRDNWIYSNTARGVDLTYAGGGGVYIAGGNPLVQNNAIYSNTAIITGSGSSDDGGGGIYVYQGGALIEGNVIWGNYVYATQGRSGGGGIYVFGSDASATVIVRDNTIATNTARVFVYPGGGGGLYVQADNSLVEHNQVYSNSLEISSENGGGGIFVGSSASPYINYQARIRGNTIYRNSVKLTGGSGHKQGGGGIYVFNVSAIVESNRIVDNRATGLRGGGILIMQDTGTGQAVIQSNLIQANSSATGGGIGLRQLYSTLNPTLANNTLYDNQASTANGGGGIYREAGSPSVYNNILANNTHYAIASSSTPVLTVYNSDFWNNPDGNCTAANTTCDAAGDNLFVDPNFVNSGTDFHLQAGSDCIDVASPDLYADVDLDGYARPFGLRADIGAYEYYTGACFARLNGGGNVYTNVQTAIDAASYPTDVVHVAGLCTGVTPRLVGSQTLSQSAYISQGLGLRGGYTLTDWLVPSTPTVLDAQTQGRLVYITGTGTVTVENLVLRGGQAGMGGGLYMAAPLSLTIRNVIFDGNEASNRGGGAAFAGGSPRVYHATFVGNQAANFGGGIYAAAGSPLINSSLIAHNRAGAGGGLYAEAGATPVLDYNLWWDNLPGGNYENASGGPHDIAREPNFLDALFRLGYDSPAIHMADPSTGLGHDWEGDARPQGRASDIGADEATAYPDMTLGPDNNASVAQNQVVTYFHYLANTGTAAGSYTLSYNSNVTWTVSLSPALLTVPRGAVREVWVRVEVPADIPSSTLGIITLTASTPVHPYLKAQAVNTTLVNLWPGVAITPSYDTHVNPGTVELYPHTLINTGSGMDSFTLTFTSRYGWSRVTPLVITDVETGQSASLWVKLDVPPTVPGGVTETIRLVATSHYSPEVQAVVTDVFVVNHTPGTRYVATQSPFARDTFNNCTMYITPCKTIAYGAAQATSGDTVKVAAGTYYEHDLTLNQDIVLRGGYNSQASSSTGVSHTIQFQVPYLLLGLAANPYTNRLYAVARDETDRGYVRVIDGRSGNHITDIPVGSGPSGYIAINPDTNFVYVVNQWSESLSVIDGFSNKVIATIPNLDEPRAVAANPATNRVYVTHDWMPRIYAIDTLKNEWDITINLGGSGWFESIAVNPKTNLAYVSRAQPAPIDVIHLSMMNKSASLSVPGYPSVNPNTGLVYVSRFDENKLSVVDDGTNRVIKTIDLPGLATIPAVNAARNCVYVYSQDPSDNSKDFVSIVDGEMNISLKKLDLPTTSHSPRAQNVAVDSGTGFIYVARGYSIDLIEDATCGTWAIYDFKQNLTTIDAQAAGRALYVFGNPIVEGFTLQNGKAAGAGGGVYIGQGSPTIRWNNILSNTASVYGGGVYAGLGAPILLGNTIQGNTAGRHGGGVYNAEGHAVLLRNTLAYNTAGEQGGGVALESGSPALWSNMVYGNQAKTGGGVYLSAEQPSIWNDTLYGNQAQLGGGLYLAGSGVLAVRNMLIANNSASIAGGGVYSQATNAFLDYNNVWGNSAPGGTANYAGTSANEHDMSADPSFVDAGKLDLHLSAASPCIDHGFKGDATVDWEGQPRVMGWPPHPHTDIGADEYQEAHVILEPDYPDGAAYPAGTPSSYIHTVTNTGNSTDTFSLGWTNSHGWRAMIDNKAIPITLTLGSGLSKSIEILVGPLPKDAISGTLNTTLITATSQFNVAISDTVVDTTTVLFRSAGVSLTSELVEADGVPFTTLYYTHAVTNSSNYTDIINLALTGQGGIGSITDRTKSIKMGPGMSQTVVIWVDVPLEGHLCYSTLSTTLSATSDFNPAVSDTVRMTTTILPYTAIEIRDQWARVVSSATAPIQIHYTNDIHNLNNCYTDTFTITPVDVSPYAPFPMPAQYAPYTITLPPLIDGQLSVTATVDAGTPPVCALDMPDALEYHAKFQASGTWSSNTTEDVAVVNECLSVEWVPPTDSTIVTDILQDFANYSPDLCNRGNRAEQFRLWWQNTGEPKAWTMKVDGKADPKESGGVWIELERNECKAIDVELDIPDDVHYGDNYASVWTHEYWQPFPRWILDVFLKPSSGSWQSTAAFTTTVRRPDVTLDTDDRPDPRARKWAVAPGTTVTHVHYLTNTGALTDSYTISGTNQPDWNMAITPRAVYSLGPGQATRVIVTLDVPAGLLSNTLNVAIVTATSQVFTQVRDLARDESSVIYVPSASLTPEGHQQAKPGETVTYSHQLVNNGNYTDSFNLVTHSSFGYAEVRSGYNPVKLGPGESYSAISVTIQLPTHAAIGDVERTELIAVFQLAELQVVAVDYTTIDTVPIPGTRYVAVTGSDHQNNCRDPFGYGPCQTIQHAANQAAGNDEIRIAQGTYVDLGTVDNHKQVVYLGQDLTLRGGYALSDWFESRPTERPTTLDAGGQGRVIYIEAGRRPTIEGLGLRGGFVNGSGGGVYAATGAIPSLQANLIYNNNAQGGAGGGVYGPSGAILQNNIVYTNSADLGGGVYAGEGKLVMEHNTLYDNDASSGGAVYQLSGTLCISNSILANNTAGDYAVRAGANTSATLDSNAMWANRPADSDVAGSNTYAFDPRFENAAPGTSNPDLHLSNSSPAIDLIALSSATRDVDGDGRPELLAYDLGADEFAVRPALEMAPPSYSKHTTETQIAYVHVLTNAGNFTDTINLAASIRPGWGVAVWPASVELPDGGSATVHVTVTIPTAEIGERATAIVTATSQWNAGQVFAVVYDTAAYQNDSDLEITKSAEPAGWLKRGDAITYTLVYSTRGPAEATRVVVTDLLPAHLVNPAYSSSGAAITPIGGETYAWAVGTLPPGTGGIITVTAIVSPSGQVVAGLCNTAHITTTQYDTPTNNTAQALSWIDTAPPLAPPGALLSPANGHITSAQTISFRWLEFDELYTTLRGSGVFSYELAVSGIVDSGPVHYQGIAYSPTLTYTLSGLDYGVYTWTVRAFDAVGNAGEYATPNTFRSGVPRMTVTKQLEPASPVAGAPFTYLLSVSNRGVGPATSVVLVDTVPDGATYISGGTYEPSGRTATWVIPIIEVDGTAQLPLVIRACRAVTNTLYRVTASAEGITTASGAPVAAVPTAPTITAAFTQSNAGPGVNEQVYFTSTTTSTGGSIVAWHWQWGDGTQSVAGSGTSQHTYTTAGVYRASLTVTDTCGYTGTASHDISAASKPSIRLSPMNIEALINPGDSLIRMLTISNVGLADLTWDMVASPVVTWLAASPAEGTVVPGGSAKVAIILSASGLTTRTFTTTLHVNSNDPDEGRIDVPVTLVVTDSCIPVSGADFDFQPALPLAGQAVTFTGNIAQASQPVTYTWSLGYSGRAVYHTFPAAGQYGVALTVENSCPGAGSLYSRVTKTVTIIAPDIALSADALAATLRPGQTSTHTLVIDNVGTAGLSWTLSENPPLDWLSASPTSGQVATGGRVSVTVTSVAPLARGVYTTSLQISSNDPDEALLSVPMTVTVVAPDITLNPPQLEVASNPDRMTTRTLSIGNIGTASLSWRISESVDEAWLSVPVTSGSVGPAGLNFVTVVLNTAGMGEGIYTAALRVDSDDPAKPSLIVPVTLTVTIGCVPAAEVDFNFEPAAPQPGDTVVFTANVAQGTPPIAYLWLFGDGGAALGETVYHTYRFSDTYSVVVTATSPCGSPIATRRDVAVSGPNVTPVYGVELAPEALSLSGVPGSGVNYQLTLSNTGNAADTFELSAAGSWPASIMPDMVSLAPGGVTRIIVTVLVPGTANDGDSDVTSVTASSQGDPEVSDTSVLTTSAALNACIPVTGTSFSFAPANPHIGDVVTFTASAEGSPPILYVWNFGDGGSAVGSVVYHSYRISATFPVVLTASNACGGPLVAQRTLTVTTPGSPPVFGVLLTPEADAGSGVAGNRVIYQLTVSNTSTAADTFELSVTGAWPSQPSPELVNLPPLGAASISVTVNIPATASIGQSDTAIITAVSQGDPEVSDTSMLTTTAVFACTPVAGASFSFAPVWPLVGQTVTFSGIVTAGDPPIAYTWDFGDGASGTGAVAHHAYQRGGNYQVTMTVTNACGELTTPPQTITVWAHQIYLPVVIKNMSG